MSGIKTNEKNAKRKFLKNTLGASAVLGGAFAVPSEWKKPLIDSVVIPSHAMMGSGGMAGGTAGMAGGTGGMAGGTGG